MAGNIGRKDLDLQTNEKLKNRLLGITTEVGTGIGTDFLTGGLLNPITLKATGGLSGLAYAGINGFQGAYTNYLVQKHLYGEENVKWGEIISSGALSAIPFMNLKAGKNIANIVGDTNTVRRGLVGGAGMGLAGEQLRVGIDEGRRLEPYEAVAAVGVGGSLGGITQAAGPVVKNTLVNTTSDYLSSRPYSRLWNPARTLDLLRPELQGSVGAANINKFRERLLASDTDWSWKNRPTAVNTLEYNTYEKLINKMEEIAVELEFDTTGIRNPTQYIKSRFPRKRYKKLKQDPTATLTTQEIEDIYVAYEIKYWEKLQHLKEVNSNFRGDMQRFPDLIHEGETFRPQVVATRGILKGASIDNYNTRVARRAQGKSNRLSDLNELNEHSGGSTRAFLDAKRDGFAELNERLQAEGKDPLGNYILDGDHKLPVAMTARYGKKLSPKNRRIVYNAIRAAGGALGDEYKNVTVLTGLINRQKQKNLGKRLRALKHKPAKSFKTQKARVLYYTTPSPETGLTPIEEYVKAAYLTEVWAEEQMNAFLNTLPVLRKGLIKDLYKNHRDQYNVLVEVFGSEKGINDFIDSIDDQVYSWMEDIVDFSDPTGKSLIISKAELDEMMDADFLRKLKDNYIMGEIWYKLKRLKDPTGYLIGGGG